MQKQKGNNGMQVRVSIETYKQLVQLGNLEDTFDTVIQRLLKGSKK